MLLKEYTKSGKYNFVLALKKTEFNYFLNKFYGSLISRGKKSFAIKQFNEILFKFKKKFKLDPFIELHKSINNLIPILSSTQKKTWKNISCSSKFSNWKKTFCYYVNMNYKKTKK